MGVHYGSIPWRLTFVVKCGIPEAEGRYTEQQNNSGDFSYNHPSGYFIYFSRRSESWKLVNPKGQLFYSVKSRFRARDPPMQGWKVNKENGDLGVSPAPTLSDHRSIQRRRLADYDHGHAATKLRLRRLRASKAAADAAY